jgi:hypothetical protein
LKYPPLLSILAAGLACCAANAQISRLGAMGDSLSDEYAEESYSYAKNWTMQFVLYRGVNMGPTAAAAQQPGGTWGEPRRTYYQSNWARYGDTTDDLLADGQHTGLAAQVAPLGISHAVLMIGANDFNSVGLGAYFNIYNGFWSTSQINTYVAGRIANVRTALDTVAPHRDAPRPRECFRLRDHPDHVGQRFLQRPKSSETGSPPPFSRSTPVFSLSPRSTTSSWLTRSALPRRHGGTNQNPRTTLLLGNVTIQLRQYDTSTNTNPTAAFVHDRAHPHTTMQGVLANILVEALNQGYGAGLTPFTEEEILSHAGLAYGGQNTLSAVIGPLSSYVHNFVCYANCDGSTAAPVLNVNDFSCFLNRYAAGDARANCDNSTVAPVLNVNDFSCFLNRYAVGCP